MQLEEEEERELQIEEDEEKASYRKIRVAREEEGQREVDLALAMERSEFLDEADEWVKQMRIKFPDNWWCEEAVNWRDLEEWMLSYMVDDADDWMRRMRGERVRGVKLTKVVEEEMKEFGEMIDRQKEQEAKIKIEYARFAEDTTEDTSGEETDGREDDTPSRAGIREEEKEVRDERERKAESEEEEAEMRNGREKEEEDMRKEMLKNRYEKEEMYDEKRKEIRDSFWTISPLTMATYI